MIIKIDILIKYILISITVQQLFTFDIAFIIETSIFSAGT